VLNLAAADETARAQAVAETERAAHIARRIPTKVLVTHIGAPRPLAAGQELRAAARRSIEQVQRIAEPLGVQVAIEIIPNELSRAASLVHFLERDLEAAAVNSRPVGICLDFGHAHMDGDLLDAIETVSEHVVTTHLHDNPGRHDAHLVPFEGTIDWPAAMTAIQKVGYDGTLLLEIGAHGSTKETLARARKARQRLEKLLAQ
jgi:sugar phosphate isomerase/epimerase